MVCRFNQMDDYDDDQDDGEDDQDDGDDDQDYGEGDQNGLQVEGSITWMIMMMLMMSRWKMRIPLIMLKERGF